MAEGGDTVSVLSDEDVVADLLSVPFSRRQFNEKMDIVKKGRPTPERLEITKVTKAGYERHFQASNWERYPWLTGSVRHKKLYCWACLLFGTDKGAWNWKGYDNLDSFTKSALKHEGSASHLKSTITLKTFGDARIDLQLDEQRRRDISMHNEKVKKNRELLKRLINAVVFLGKQELSFRGHDESKTSLNRGNYVELLSYSAEHDPDLHYHLTTNKVFIGTSSQIQNDLISAVADVLNDAIKEEINKTPFVSLMMDETSDVSNAAQLSLVLRYVTDSGIKERFIKMVDVSGNKRAADLATLAFEFLEEYGCTDKLIAQCYDGAPVMASGLNGVQAKVKEKIPDALFIHCYAHVLNLVLSQGVAKIKECKIFLSHLSSMAAFFSKSPKRTQLLDEMCQKRLPRVAPTRWNFASRLVCTVFEEKDALKNVFEHIVDHHDEYDNDSIDRADGFISQLSSFEFCFLLSTFHEMFSHADVLFDILQKHSFDMQFSLRRVDEFCIHIEGQRALFDQRYDETVMITGVPDVRRARGDPRSYYSKLHESIIENILNQMQTRFKDHEKLSFLALLDPSQFNDYKKRFPETAFTSLTDNYGPRFDCARLKTELQVMYSMADFHGKDPSDLLLFLKNKDLCDSMHQLYKLTCLVVTIPVTTSSVERTFSALKRIKTYSRNTTGQSRLSALASMSIEKEMLMDLKTKDKLHDPVIEKFTQKDRRMDFVFR